MVQSVQSQASKASSKPRIIVGFPGVGKTYTAKRNPKFREVDLGQFKADDGHNANPFDRAMSQFDEYYNDPNVEMIFFTSHTEIIKDLMRREVPFSYVYPALQLKEEYLERYRARPNHLLKAETMVDLFDVFVKQAIALKDDSGLLEKIEIIEPGMYLQDVIYPFPKAI